ncbi:sensor domain-containing diguanylate cyclase [Marinobacter sp. F4206]|uniref:sensor domain-containing diguanylate cyclase n=1 Tax=Marinobacter sp. F4206 TaxID=2861777 RepID=UPI001C602608|nr:diguanylate cyclase [Marinobacter sp. F4206]MBW4934960.1 sensor domain-containing diguanylate cyclase [Marinobacter sp. F4206]
MISKPSLILRAVVLNVLCLLSVTVFANTPITVGENERGDQKTGHARIMHDPRGDLDLPQVLSALEADQFGPLQSAGSTGLKTGAYWSHFQLRNPLPQPLTMHLEYVDHQLIQLDAFSRPRNEGDFKEVASLSMERPFSHRLVEHNRFVVPLTLAANQTRDVLIRYGSRESGYAFPSMRIWSPEQLETQKLRETTLIGFLFGGFFLMATFALIAGLISRKVLFFVYSLYALSKITCWATILGYTHQFVLRDQFHWSLMSSSGALTILLGLTFARMFLQTRQYARRLDYVILFMTANAGLLLFAAAFQIKVIALITITLALLLYPLVIVAGLIRWRQGQTEAGIFSLAWSFLVMGLFMQAFRDLGLVEHTLFNYYWPPVASFSEMLTIMFAMGFQMRRVYQDKKSAERQYREHLELSKSRLEAEVRIRTRELEQAKRVAEQEARTDPLTGILNRRSFLHDACLRLKLAKRQQKPCCLFMFDLDHFKRINDTFGHSTGDAVLCQFAETISRSIRATDVFGRMGGEEFALLVGEPKDSAHALAERLRSDIAGIKITVGENTLVLTASIGLACNHGEATIEALLLKADEAMYQAKVSGRNRVVEAEAS